MTTPAIPVIYTCHYPGCGLIVPGKMWACRIHWTPLPAELRNLIWETYDGAAAETPEYLEAAAACVAHWESQN
jgi:hypothetical protein